MEELHKDITRQILEDYKPVTGFVKKFNNKLDYVQFDYYVVNEINLFSIRENYDFSLLSNTLIKIRDALPAIKRIFSKPLIHLKDQDEIRPVESVYKINNETIVHASVHSELWANITPQGLKPRKLLTLNNQDNYSIYENVAFAYCIRTILSYLHRNLRELKEFMYANRSMNFNLLERVDHINYYLAIGKLHTGYIRNFEKYHLIIDSSIQKMNSLNNIISARLNRPVFKKNSGLAKKGKFVLRKTNILNMQKDYRKIYNLLRYFQNEKIEIEESVTSIELDGLLPDYVRYCKFIIIFAIGHFNYFESKAKDNKKKINFNAVSMRFCFSTNSITDKNVGTWILNFREKKVDGRTILILDIAKDEEYKIAIIPMTSITEDRTISDAIKEEVKAQKYFIATPYEDDKDTLFLSINNVESFRRVQQQLLCGMVYADKTRDVCPFCGHEMGFELADNGEIVKDEEDSNVYHCANCRQEIRRKICPETKEEYFITTIKDYKKYIDTSRRISYDDSWVFRRQVEEQMHFRNITMINQDGDTICPNCGKVHLDNKNG